MEKATQLTTKDKEAVLKMAGVLIRTEYNYGIGELFIAFSSDHKAVARAYNRDRVINVAFNKLQQE